MFFVSKRFAFDASARSFSRRSHPVLWQSFIFTFLGILMLWLVLLLALVLVSLSGLRAHCLNGSQSGPDCVQSDIEVRANLKFVTLIDAICLSRSCLCWMQPRSNQVHFMPKAARLFTQSKAEWCHEFSKKRMLEQIDCYQTGSNYKIFWP